MARASLAVVTPGLKSLATVSCAASAIAASIGRADCLPNSQAQSSFGFLMQGPTSHCNSVPPYDAEQRCAPARRAGRLPLKGDLDAGCTVGKGVLRTSWITERQIPAWRYTQTRRAKRRVPLLGRKRVHGSINILWIKTAFTVEDFAARHLNDLQQAARDIVNSLREPAKISAGK